MILLKKIFCGLLCCGLCLSALAQSKWQFGAGVRYAKNQGRGKYPAQPLNEKAFHLSAERIHSYSGTNIVYTFTTGYRQTQGNKPGILVYPYAGISERLVVDNIVLGAGIQFNFLKNGRYQPLCGVRGYWGIPMRVYYKLANPRAELEHLPAFLEIKNNAYQTLGLDTYIGLEVALNKKSSIRMKWGLGTRSQRVNWTIHDRHVTPLPIIYGGQWWGGIEYVHKFRVLPSA